MRAILLVLVACGSAPAHHGARLSTPRASHSTSLLADGTLLVTGGFRKGPDGHSQLYFDSTEIFDPVANTTVPGPRLGEPRCGHGTVTLDDGSILIVGGWNAGGVIATAELFDPQARQFVRVGSLATARGALTATKLANGHVLVIGGSDDHRSLASVEEYDPSTRTWHDAGALVAPRAGHSATLLGDGRVLVVGGESGRDAVLDSAELFDPATGHSAATGSLAVARYKHAAVAMASGDVMVIAGSDARDWRGKLETTEVYDVHSGTFHAGPTLTEKRFKLGHAVVALPNGDIAIAGGAATIERVGATSRAIGTLDAASYFGTATLVPSGDLIVVGGYDDRVRVSASITRIALNAAH